MLWIILTIVFALMAAGGWVAARYKDIRHPKIRDRYGDKVPNPDADPVTTWPYRWQGRGVMIGALVVWFLLTMLFSVKAVKAGDVGIVRQFGSIVGQQSEGVNFIAPWQSMDSVSIRTQRVKFENLTAASSETQDVSMTVTVNYSVSEEAVQDLIRNVGTNWFDVLVPARVANFVKAESAQWKTADIIPHRNEIRAHIQIALQESLSQHSITISDLLIENITFSDDYLAAIEAKQVATENAQAAQNRVAQITAEAEQRRQEAQGEADAVEIAAQGQANANDLINASLTPSLIQWQAIQALGDNVDVIMIPSGEGLILDPSTILAGTPPTTEG